ncbi:MAG: hypothetical protein QGG42_07960, partial [Phycisphaerae bacterium]|nr:hypothetical protein [Phycisphaerae bacterium]
VPEMEENAAVYSTGFGDPAPTRINGQSGNLNINNSGTEKGGRSNHQEDPHDIRGSLDSIIQKFKNDPDNHLSPASINALQKWRDEYVKIIEDAKTGNSSAE